MKNTTASVQARLSAFSKEKTKLLELLLTKESKHSNEIKAQPRRHSDRSVTMPISGAQQRLWFINQLEGGSTAYHTPLLLRLSGDLDPGALRTALDMLIARHEILRTTFAKVDGEAVQQIAATCNFAIQMSAVNAADTHAGAEEVKRQVREEMTDPFDLTELPLIRAKLLQLAPQEHMLLITMHHIVSDGWSLGVVTRELATLYAACREGITEPLPPLPVQYADYAHWQREWLSSPQFSDQMKYWLEHLRGAPEQIELPLDRSRPPVRSYRGANVPVPLGPQLTADLKSLARRHGLTLAMLLHAGWSALLSRLTSQQDIVIGIPVANRRRAELEGLVGFFVNTLAIRIQLHEHLTVTQLLQQTKETLLGAYANQDVPFEKVVERLRPARSLSHSPVFQVMFAWHNAPQARLSSSGLTIHQQDVELPTAQFDLSLSLRETPSGITGSLNFASDLFDATTIRRWITCFATILSAMTREEDSRVSRLPLMNAEDRRVLDVLTSGPVARFDEQSIHQAFEEQVRRTPHALALTVDEQSLTYAELNERANQLAHYLRYRGVGPGELVGICLERSAELVVSLIAVLKAGSAYIPLDPSYPRERLAYMIEDATPRVVLTHSSLGTDLRVGEVEVVELDAACDQIARQERADLGSRDPGDPVDNLAYVIYTSGSTGQPKGVMVPHRAVLNLYHSLEALYRRSGPCWRIALNASLNFDASVQQVLQLLSGRTVFIVPQELRRDPRLLLEFLRQNTIDAIDCTPSQLKAWINQGLLESPGISLRLVLVGGEAIDSDLWTTLANCPKIAFYNVYGPTECTVDATVALLTGDSSAPHIGRPMLNRRVHILDQYGEPVPIGIVGEMWIGGAGVACGYWRRADLTAQRFIPDRFGTNPQHFLYRTGDFGRWRHDGNIEYLGRNDRQVKIRGYRIELGEIEVQLARDPHVKEAAVLARQDVAGEKRLVAYVVAHEASSPPSVADLRRRLQTALPEHMVPSAFVILDSLPMTPSGKLDRRALPAPELGAYASRAYEPPRGEVEESLAGIWQALLRVERVGRQDNFFELGGHSLLIMQMMERLTRVGLSTEVRRVFESATLADLARTLLHEASARFEIPPNLIASQCASITPHMLPLVELNAADIERIVSAVPGGVANIEDIYPLLPLQEGILFHHLLDGNDTYVLGTALLVSSRQRLNELIAALQGAIDRHDVLRTAVLWEQLPQPVQVVCRKVALPVEEVSLDPQADVVDQIQERLKPGKQAIDLRRAPLMRLQIAADPHCRGRWYALLQTHHITTDHVTSNIVIQEIVSELEGRRSPPAACAPYRNHVALTLNRARENDARDYFRDKFHDVDEPTAPFGLLNVRGDATSIEQARSVVPHDLVQRTRIQARRLGVSAATVLHAAWALVVAGTSGRDDIVFGSVLLGRLHSSAGAQQALGLFINTLPLRLTIREVSVQQLIEQAQRGLVELLTHEQASLAEAQRCSGIVGSAPLFTALFNYRHSLRSADSDWSNASGIETVGTQERTNYPITISVDDFGEGLTLAVQTDRRIEPRRVADYLQTALQSLVHALEREPQTPAHALSILPAGERRELESFNATHVSRTRDRLIHNLFEDQAMLTPDAQALVHSGRTLTYAQLNAKANQLAWHLRRKGIAPGQLVAVCMERSVELIVGVLGVLKAGAAYVPLDPNYPAERLQYMLQDAAPQLVLAHVATKTLVRGAAKEIVALDGDWERFEAGSCDNLQVPGQTLTPDNPVYVIYTSGSTGRPKGTVMSHGAMVNLIEWHRQTLPGAAGLRVLQFAALSFDVAFQEIFSTLSTGCTLVLVDEAVRRDARALLSLLHEEQIQRLFVPPLMLQSLAEWCDIGQRDRLRLQDVIVAGEQLRVSPEIVAFFEHLRGCCLHNHYGPTETHVVTSLTLTGEPRHWPTLPTIGRPIANTQIHILNSRREPLPIGVAGEVHIGGANVACGYLRRPELTAERFLPDPFSDTSGARMYRTGDLARRLADGTIEYLGRNDDQVKIRGYRIELGEIEAQLARHPQVREVAVVVRDDIVGEKRLVAYITSREEVVPGSDDLRAHLKSSLPEYMVPTAFVHLQSLPRTPSGKLDRRVLPAPEPSSCSDGQYQTPQGQTEEVLARIWQDVIGVSGVGRNDNFFSLGGHSLLALKALLRINQACGCALRVIDLYNSPTLREVAERISGSVAADGIVHLAGEATLDDCIKALPVACRTPARAVLLTGATGFVGRFLLDELLRSTQATIHCLVRASSQAQAAARLVASMIKWDLWDEGLRHRIVPVAGDLRLPRLGIDQESYRTLSRNVDAIYHCGTSMNHLETYAMAKPSSVEAARQLLDLATADRPKLVNYISTLGVFAAAATDVPRVVDESSSIDNERYRQSQGYLASKWVAEKIFMLATDRGIPCNIFRLGLVWADSQSGRFDELQNLYRVLKSCLMSGFGIANYRYPMPPTPVDYVSRSIRSLTDAHPQGGGVFHVSSSQQAVDGVFEICNSMGGLALELLPYYEWICRMKHLHQRGWSMPAVPLIEFAFSMDEAAFAEHQRNFRSAANIRFDLRRTHQELEKLGIVAPILDDTLLAKCIEDMFRRDRELLALGQREFDWLVQASAVARGSRAEVGPLAGQPYDRA